MHIKRYRCWLEFSETFLKWVPLAHATSTAHAPFGNWHKFFLRIAIKLESNNVPCLPNSASALR